MSERDWADEKAEMLVDAAGDDDGWFTDAVKARIASALRAAAAVPAGCVRIGSTDYKDERMYWNPESPEDAIDDPYDIIDAGDLIEGDPFRLWVAVRLPSQVFITTLVDDKYGYREATPEETAAHEADEKAERERRKAHFDEINRKNREAAQAALAAREGK